MDEPLKDPLQLVKELVLLIVEARTPDLSVKGRVEGPHCPVIRGRPAHKCNAEKTECLRASEYCYLAQRLWMNGIPVCIDTILFPDCSHGNDEALVTEGTVSKVSQENAMLVERWTILAYKKRQEDGLSSNMLQQAVRSYLHFSQISSWLYSAAGKLPGILAYRIYAPGEGKTLEFQCPPDTHHFPACRASGRHVNVTVMSLQRLPSIPLLPCYEDTTRAKSPSTDFQPKSTDKEFSRRESGQEPPKQSRTEYAGSLSLRSYEDIHFPATKTKGGKFREEPGAMGDHSGQKRMRERKARNVKSLQEQVSAKVLSSEELYSCGTAAGYSFPGERIQPKTTPAAYLMRSEIYRQPGQTLSQADISAKKAQNLARMNMTDSGDTTLVVGDVICSTKTHMRHGTQYTDEDDKEVLVRKKRHPKSPELEDKMTRAFELSKGHNSGELMQREQALWQQDQWAGFVAPQWQRESEGSDANRESRLGRGVKKKDAEKDLRIEQMKDYWDRYTRSIDTDKDDNVGTRHKKDNARRDEGGAVDMQTVIKQKKKVEYSKLCKSLDGQRPGLNLGFDMLQGSGDQDGQQCAKFGKGYRQVHEDNLERRPAFETLSYRTSSEGVLPDCTEKYLSKKLDGIDVKMPGRKKTSLSQIEAKEEEFIRKLSERMSLGSTGPSDKSAISQHNLSARPKEVRRAKEMTSNSQNDYWSKQIRNMSEMYDSSTASDGVDITSGRWSNRKTLKSDGSSMSMLTIDVSRSPELDDSDSTPVASPNHTPRLKSLASESLVKSVAEKTMKQNLQLLQNSRARASKEKSPFNWLQYQDHQKQQGPQDGYDLPTNDFAKQTAQDLDGVDQLRSSLESGTVSEWKTRSSQLEKSKAGKLDDLSTQSHDDLNQSANSIWTSTQREAESGDGQSPWVAPKDGQWTYGAKTSGQENQFVSGTVDHKTGSRKVFEQNLLPLVSYDADSDSFKKVEQSYSSQILHSPKVLFSCDVPSSGRSDLKKCIDFGEDLESDFFKSKVGEMLGPEAIGKYMSNLAAMSVSALNRNDEVDGDFTALIACDRGNKLEGINQNDGQMTATKTKQDNQSKVSQILPDRKWTVIDSDEGLIFDGEFSDEDVKREACNKFPNIGVESRPEWNGSSTVDAHGEKEDLTSEMAKFEGSKNMKQTRRQLTYKNSVMQLDDKSEAVAQEVAAKPVDDKKLLPRIAATEEPHQGTWDRQGDAPKEGHLLSPPMSASFSSSSSSSTSSSSASTVYLRSSLMSPPGQMTRMVPSLNTSLGSEDGQGDASSQEEQMEETHADDENGCMSKEILTNDTADDVASNHTGIPKRQRIFSPTRDGSLILPTAKETDLTPAHKIEGNDSCNVQSNNEDLAAAKIAISKPFENKLLILAGHAVIKGNEKLEARERSFRDPESPVTTSVSLSVSKSSTASPAQQKSLSAPSGEDRITPAVSAAPTKNIATSSSASASHQPHPPPQQLPIQAVTKSTCHNTSTSPTRLSKVTVPRPSLQDSPDGHHASKSQTDLEPPKPATGCWQSTVNILPVQNGLDFGLQRPDASPNIAAHDSSHDEDQVKFSRSADDSVTLPNTTESTQFSNLILTTEITSTMTESASLDANTYAEVLNASIDTPRKHQDNSLSSKTLCSDIIKTSSSTAGEASDKYSVRQSDISKCSDIKNESKTSSLIDSSHYEMESIEAAAGLSSIIYGRSIVFGSDVAITSSQQTDTQSDHFQSSLSSKCDKPEFQKNPLTLSAAVCQTDSSCVPSKNKARPEKALMRETDSSIVQLKSVASETVAAKSRTLKDSTTGKLVKEEIQIDTTSKGTQSILSNNAISEMLIPNQSNKVVHSNLIKNEGESPCPVGKYPHHLPSRKEGIEKVKDANRASDRAFESSSSLSLSGKPSTAKDVSSMQSDRQDEKESNTSPEVKENDNDIDYGNARAKEKEGARKTGDVSLQNSSMHHGFSSAKIIQTRLDSKSGFEVDYDIDVEKDDEGDEDNNADDNGDDDDDDDASDVVFYISEPKEEEKTAARSSLSRALQENKPAVGKSSAIRPSSLSAEVDLELRSRLDGISKVKTDLGSRSPPLHGDPPGWTSTPPHRTVSTPSCMDREPKGQGQRSPTKASVIQQLNCDSTSQLGLRKMAVRSTSMIFNGRTGLPTQSSPAPLKRKSGGKFDYDPSLVNTRAIKSAFSCSKLASNELEKCGENEEEKKRTLSASAPASTNCLLGNFEESILNGRIDPVGTVDGFTAEIGASGTFCPKHLHLPVSAFFFALSDDNAPSPYLGHINLNSASKKGYHIPKKGTVQVTLFNPNKTVVKMFVVMYDLSDMPPSSQTFIRQRTIYCPTDKNSTAPSYLRYLIHLRCASSRSGKIYLHTDIRLIFARNKLDIDAKTVPYELKSFTEGPKNPKYSPKK